MDCGGALREEGALKEEGAFKETVVPRAIGPRSSSVAARRVGPVITVNMLCSY